VEVWKLSRRVLTNTRILAPRKPEGNSWKKHRESSKKNLNLNNNKKSPVWNKRHVKRRRRKRLTGELLMKNCEEIYAFVSISTN